MYKMVHNNVVLLYQSLTNSFLYALKIRAYWKLFPCTKKAYMYVHLPFYKYALLLQPWNAHCSFFSLVPSKLFQQNQKEIIPSNS